FHRGTPASHRSSARVSPATRPSCQWSFDRRKGGGPCDDGQGRSLPMKTAFALVLATAAFAGCIVVPRRGGPPPPPAAGPPPMSYEEAVDTGARYAQSRGFAFRLKKADLEHHRVWKVRFDVE